MRIAVVINKRWEAAPIRGVFECPYATGSLASARPYQWNGQPYPPVVPWPDTGATFPFRYTLSVGSIRVECWCLADFEDTSDSGTKNTFIPKIIEAGPQPDLIIGVGTAASIPNARQGSVFAGCKGFLHDPGIKPPPAQLEWPASMMDKLMTSVFLQPFGQLLQRLSIAWNLEVERRLLVAPNGGAMRTVTMHPNLIAVSDVNVGDPTKYAVCDPLAIDACRQFAPLNDIASIETTTALIQAKAGNIPFLFISGIANETGLFARDVSGTEYAQNFVASHNMGVVLAWLLPQLASLL